MIELCRKQIGLREYTVQMPVSRVFRGRVVDVSDATITVGPDVTVGALYECFKEAERHEMPPETAVPQVPLVTMGE